MKQSNIYVRIRPEASDGGGHDKDGKAVEKSLEGFTDTSVSINTQYMFSKGHADYKFPKKVLKPEA